MPFPYDKYPWLNFQELNLAYFIQHFREIFQQWDQLLNDMYAWKTATDADLAEWKSTVEAGISSWETGLQQSMEDWKDETESDISAWEAATLSALDAWKTATTAVFEQIRTEAAASATAAAGSASYAQIALAGAQAAQAAAEAAAAGISASAAQISTNTTNIANIKNTLVKRGSIVSHNAVPVAFDTAARTITMNNSVYCVYGNARYNISNLSCLWSETGSADSVCFYDITQQAIRTLVHTSFQNLEDKILLFVFHKTEIGLINQLDIDVSYSVDGTIFNVKTRVLAQETGQNADQAMSQKATSDAINSAETNIKARLQPVGRITWNGANGANVVSFDTTNRTITFGSSAFLTFMSDRYSLGNKSCTYPSSGSTMVCYYNIADAQIHAVAHSSFDPTGNIILFDFLRANWGVDANSLYFNYSVDGVNYVCKEKKRADEMAAILYVGPSGSDTAAGTKSAPLATLGEAITRGAKNICLLNGEYRISAAMEFSNLLNLSIFADDTDTYPSPSAPKERPTFIGGDAYTSFTTEVDGTRSFVPDSVPARYTRVFIDHTLDPMTTGTRPSPNACLWLHYAQPANDKKMVPVLTTADLLAGTDVFYYDGTKIYINTSDTSFISATVGFDYNEILKFTACNNISITGINFKFGGNSNLILLNCSNATIKNCKSAYTSFSDGVSTNFSESTFINCESFKARNDGFNCHFYGVSHYIDCHSHYNGDDGESSHEYCVVEVNGGEYDHNGKGGHSPVNGCKFYDNGSYSHHNAFGFYCVAQGSESTTYMVEPMLIMNAVAVNNTTDILANRAEVIVGNTKYVTHSEINEGTLTDLNS